MSMTNSWQMPLDKAQMETGGKGRNGWFKIAKFALHVDSAGNGYPTPKAYLQAYAGRSSSNPPLAMEFSDVDTLRCLSDQLARLADRLEVEQEKAEAIRTGGQVHA